MHLAPLAVISFTYSNPPTPSIIELHLHAAHNHIIKSISQQLTAFVSPWCLCCLCHYAFYSSPSLFLLVWLWWHSYFLVCIKFVVSILKALSKLLSLPTLLLLLSLLCIRELHNNLSLVLSHSYYKPLFSIPLSRTHLVIPLLISFTVLCSDARDLCLCPLPRKQAEPRAYKPWMTPVTWKLWVVGSMLATTRKHLEVAACGSPSMCDSFVACQKSGVKMLFTALSEVGWQQKIGSCDNRPARFARVASVDVKSTYKN